MKIFILLLFFCSYICQATAKEFVVFDLITAENKPDDLPLEPMHMIYQWASYGGNYTTEEDKDYVNKLPETYVKCCYVKHHLSGNAPIYYSIDFEQWPLYNVSDELVQRRLGFYKKTLELFRETLPKNSKISWYNTGAFPDYRLLGNMSDKMYTNWQRKNDKFKSIVAEYDYMQPSLYYSKKDNITMWKNKAKAFVDEHRRLGVGKPVYAHLSPQYVDEPNKMLPGEIWKEMLDFSYINADGVIIWTFPQKKYQFKWNNDADWWKATVLFINNIKK